MREGRLSSQSIKIRLLLSDMAQPLALPVGADNDPDAAGPVRDRMATISARHAGGIAATVEELADLALVPEATVEARVHGSAPLFKAYASERCRCISSGAAPWVRHDVRINGKKRCDPRPDG